jgi:signal transduction histidine kinase/CheY-like chemotaxis protein/HPt (histidine-containing phosphotransfer) domain-containing protein
MPFTLMPETQQDTFDDKHRISIQEIHGLIEKARLLRNEQPATSNELLEKAFELSDAIQYTSGRGISMRELSVNYLFSRNYRNAVKSLEQAVQYFSKAGDQVMCRKCLNELSDIYFKLGDYELSLETLLTSLKISKEINDTFLIAEIYNKVGNIYKVIGEFQKAIEQHHIALQLFEQSGDQAQISITNFNIGNCYNWAGELDVAYNFLDKSLKSANQLRDPSLKTGPLGSLAILFTKNKNYTRAEEHFFLAIESVEQTKDEKLKADLLKSLGNLYNEQKQFTKAISTLQEALHITDKLEVKTPAHLVHLFLSNAFEQTGDYKQALFHHKKFMEITRDISMEEIAIKTKGVQLKFDLEEVKKQKELAEHSARLKDRFLSGISHELRTPLNGVLGMADLLADTHPSPEQLEYINTIRVSANNLITIINDILDYSRIKSGDVKFAEEQFNLVELLNGISQNIRIKAVQKQLVFSMTTEQGVPELIIGDKARLGQVLMNILGNAVKFTEKGSIRFHITSHVLEEDTAQFVFTITDTGIGISSERLPFIFDTFSPGSGNDTQKSEGTGLGLAIARQLIDLMNGSIQVASEVDKGSTFTITLRYKFTSPVAGGKNTEPKVCNLAEVSLLLVEDNKVNQFLGKQILTKLGFMVQIAGNGREALEMINKNHYDLILMDVNMPIMNGYELTQLIRKQLPDLKNKIPIVALTAYASPLEKEKAISIGMNDYITKPYSPQELLHVILKQLNIRMPEGKAAAAATGEKIKGPAASGMIAHLREIMNGNEEDLKKMLGMYIEQIPMINGLIKTAITAKNWDEVYQQAHKLKSSVKVLNIIRMSELISLIEEYARAHENTELIGPLFEAFRKESNAVMKVMQEAL